MPDEIVAGQDAPVVTDTATTTEAAQTNAATTDAGTDTAEGGDTSQAAQAKTFTQAELDDIVRREKSKAEAKAERRVLRTLEKVLPAQTSAPATQHRQADGPPPRASFADDEAWLDARDAWRDAQREARTTQERQREQAQKLTKTTEGLYAQAQKVAGFDREAFDELPLTRDIVETLVESDQAPQLMAYMSAHPEEVERIAGLSPKRQAAELGKLEVKLAEAKPTPPQRSKAPQALEPVKGAAAKGMPDPKDSAAWIRHQNERERARLRGS